MSVVRAILQSGVEATSIQAKIFNVSPEPIDIVSPDPYRAVWIADKTGQPYPPRRAVAYMNSRKTVRVDANKGVVATVSLYDYFDDVCAEVLVRVEFELLGMSGVSSSVIVEGIVHLSIPSIDAKIAERKKVARPRGLPVQRVDVSRSTQFDLIDTDAGESVEKGTEAK